MLKSYKHHTNISTGTTRDAIPQKADDKESLHFIRRKKATFMITVVVSVHVLTQENDIPVDIVLNVI
jgi:hypothetical protein